MNHHQNNIIKPRFLGTKEKEVWSESCLWYRWDKGMRNNGQKKLLWSQFEDKTQVKQILKVSKLLIWLSRKSCITQTLLYANWKRDRTTAATNRIWGGCHCRRIVYDSEVSNGADTDEHMKLFLSLFAFCYRCWTEAQRCHKRRTVHFQQRRR